MLEAKTEKYKYAMCGRDYVMNYNGYSAYTELRRDQLK